MSTRQKGRTTPKPSAGVPVKFPAVVKDARKLNDEKLKVRLADHLAAIDQANRLDPGEVIRTGTQERVLAGMRQSAEQVEALRAEQARRREDASISRRSLWDSLRGQPSGPERARLWEEAQEEQERKKAERRAELSAIRVVEAEERHRQRVAAGYAFEPVGGWDFDGSDALAAVFGSAQMVEWLDRRDGPPVLELGHFAMLYTALAMLAQNGGEPVRVRLNRWPLPEDVRGERRKLLAHLAANDFLQVESTGEPLTVSFGPRTMALRESFAERWAERAAKAAV